MTEFEAKLEKRMEELETEVAFLRASLRTASKRSGERVYIAEIAAKFGVSAETVRKMKGDFVGLFAIHKRTESNRIYWVRLDYDKWRAALNAKPQRRISGRSKRV